MYDTRWINMGQMMLAFLHEMLRISDPAAGLAGTRRFIMPQMTVQRLDEPDSFTQGNAEGLVGLKTELLEIFHAVFPTAIARSIAMITSFTGGFEQVLFRVVTFPDQFFDDFARIQQRFYELLLHWRSPLKAPPY